MRGDDGGETRWVLVDASAFITLVNINLLEPLFTLDGRIIVPSPVAKEITGDPASRTLALAEKEGSLVTMDVPDGREEAADYLGRDLSADAGSDDEHLAVEGDIALLALALQRDEVNGGTAPAVVVTDDNPLRKTYKALSIPVSGSIGVLIQAVERGDLRSDEATEKLYAMDEVGARLSASLVRRAERLIEDAASDSAE